MAYQETTATHTRYTREEIHSLREVMSPGLPGRLQPLAEHLRLIIQASRLGVPLESMTLDSQQYPFLASLTEHYPKVRAATEELKTLSSDDLQLVLSQQLPLPESWQGKPLPVKVKPDHLDIRLESKGISEWYQHLNAIHYGLDRHGDDVGGFFSAPLVLDWNNVKIPMVVANEDSPQVDIHEYRHLQFYYWQMGLNSQFVSQVPRGKLQSLQQQAQLSVQNLLASEEKLPMPQRVSRFCSRVLQPNLDVYYQELVCFFEMYKFEDFGTVAEDLTLAFQVQDVQTSKYSHFKTG